MAIKIGLGPLRVLSYPTTPEPQSVTPKMAGNGSGPSSITDGVEIITLGRRRTQWTWPVGHGLPHICLRRVVLQAAIATGLRQPGSDLKGER